MTCRLLSGLTEGEAKEFHGVFMTRVIIFTVIASIAHILPWKWRLWLPAAKEHVSLADSVNIAVANVLPFLAY